MNKMYQLNQNYKEKYGFPFVICARKHQKEEILQIMEHRYKNDQNLELGTAIEEILQIAELRIRDIVVDNHQCHLTKLPTASETKFTEIVLSPKYHRSAL